MPLESEFSKKKCRTLNCTLYSVMHSDWNSLKIDNFLRLHNFWINNLILIMKNSTYPYLCLAKGIIYSELALSKVWFISCGIMKSVSFRSVPI